MPEDTWWWKMLQVLCSPHRNFTTMIAGLRALVRFANVLPKIWQRHHDATKHRYLLFRLWLCARCHAHRRHAANLKKISFYFHQFKYALHDEDCASGYSNAHNNWWRPLSRLSTAFWYQTCTKNRWKPCARLHVLKQCRLNCTCPRFTILHYFVKWSVSFLHLTDQAISSHVGG